MPMAGNPNDKRTFDPDMPVNSRNFLGVREARELAIAETGMPDWAPKFLAILSQTCNVRAACSAAGIAGPTAYRTFEAFPIFREAWQDALREGRDILLQEAWTRALRGSDKMLAMLIRMYFPEYFPRGGIQALETPKEQDDSIISGERIDYDNIRSRISKRYLQEVIVPAEERDPGEG